MNWHSIYFLIFSLAACVFALAVVFSSNIVRMAFYLVLSLGATAGLFFLAGADFIGAMQLLIYVGGTLVLLVFGVMLTAQSAFISMKTGGGDWILAAIVGGALLAMLVQTAFSIPQWREGATVETAVVSGPTTTEAGLGLLGIRVDTLPVAAGAHQAAAGSTQAGGPQQAGVISGYLLPFEIVSVHLLVVLIGAAYLARAKRRKVWRAAEA